MSKMKSKRLRKIKDFEYFYDNCKSIFTKLRESDSRSDIFQNEYMLSICPGSRIFGEEKRVIEIFWGGRPYDFIKSANRSKSLIEEGATLFFYRNDTGDITISLYPAKTEYRQPVENYIALYKWLDPKKLKSEEFIKSIWNDFMAYMECTSLDGRPSIRQRLRISYLRNFKNLVIDKKWQPTKFSEFAKEVLKWVLTVGLSGVIIYLLTILTQPDSTESEIQLKEINRNLVDISKELDRISVRNKGLVSISATLDSIEVETRKVIEAIKEQK